MTRKEFDRFCAEFRATQDAIRKMEKYAKELRCATDTLLAYSCAANNLFAAFEKTLRDSQKGEQDG